MFDMIDASMCNRCAKTYSQCVCEPTTDVKHIPQVAGRDKRVIDTSELGPIKIEAPTSRQQQARIVREALEVAAAAEPDRIIAANICNVARMGHTETLAYLARLLKG